MRICLVTSSFPRYPGDYSGFFAHEQAVALSKRHEVHVIYPDSTTNSDDTFDSIERHPIPYPFDSYPLAQVHGWELAGTVRLLFDMARMVRKINRTHQVDLFYAFWTIPSGFVCSLSCGKTPILLGLMGSDLEVFGRQWMTRPFIARAIRHATKIVAVSEDLKREATGLGGNGDSIHVIPTGVDVDRFRPMDKTQLRKTLAIPQGFVWLYSGSLLKLKRVDWILRLGASLAQRHDFHILIVGDGPERQNLENLTRSLRLANVIFKGKIPREDMPLYVAASDVLLLLSETEGLPNCIQEAMAAAVPVVATNVGGISDVVTTGTTGYLVSDICQAEEALDRLMSSPSHSAELGLNALTYARQSLSLATVLEKIVTLCESTAVVHSKTLQEQAP